MLSIVKTLFQISYFRCKMSTQFAITLLLFFTTETLVNGIPTRPLRSPDLGFHVFEHSLIFYMDGRFNTLRDPMLMLEHQANLGRSKADAVAAGKAAAAIFKDMYGPEADFTNLPDDSYIDGDIISTSPQGIFSFRSFTVDPIARWRLAMEAKGLESKVYKNAKIESSGWQLNVLKNTNSAGSVQEELFAGDVAFIGDYHIEIWRDCPLRRPYGRKGDLNRCTAETVDSRGIKIPHIDINYRTPRIIRGGSTLVIDCILKHKTWGEGTAIGVIDLRQPDPTDPNQMPIARGRTVNVFRDSFDDPLAIDNM